jgi:ABC-2 type transport system ATP-binding protein
MENIVEVSHVAKSFGETRAVVDVSFNVERGEIFAMLGPNGAGKTTTIRMMLDIFKPEKGQVSILDGPMSSEKKDRIGYMPEDRGLYQDIPLERCLLYLAALKGLPQSETRKPLERYLERFDLAEHKNKKVKELSKGMQQKAQIINTLLHNPELIIIDEPFAGLDPLNLQLVKKVLLEMRDRGATIIMSTHQMHHVEELCDRILLIDAGRDVLYGNLNDIRKQFSGHEVLVRASGEFSGISGVKQMQFQNGDTKLTLEDNTSPKAVLKTLIDQDIELEKFEIAVPSLDEIFIRVVERGNG